MGLTDVEASPAAMSVIAARLRSLPASVSGRFAQRDAFVPPAAWIVVTPPDPLGNAQTVNTRAVDFCKAHRLSAVLQQGRDSMALVDDELIKVGQSIDGFTLTDVGPHSARFIGQGTSALLPLPDTSGSTAP